MSKFKLIEKPDEVWWVSTKQFDLEFDGKVSSFRVEESPKWTEHWELVEGEGWNTTERSGTAMRLFLEFNDDWPEGEFEFNQEEDDIV